MGCGQARADVVRAAGTDRPAGARARSWRAAVKVIACGVCRTDLHLAEGDLPPHHPRTTPGHEVVGQVVGDRSRHDPVRGPATGSARPGWPAPTGRAASAAAARRTSARGPPTPAGTSTAGTPSTSPWRTRSRTRSRAASATPSSRRCCARASSATGPWCAPRCPPGGTLGIWGFGGSAHLAAQVAMAQGAQVHVFTRAPGRPRPGPRAWARRRSRIRSTPRRCRWTRPSCSPRSAASCPPRWPRWTATGRWPSPGST